MGFHRFLTGVAVAVAVLSMGFSWTIFSKEEAQARQLHDQRLVNWAYANALREQRKLNAQLSISLIHVMKQQIRAAPARYLANRR